MTIKRQYVLPNCSLILEGLSTDASNVLSILANAEFKIAGLDEQSLSGGTDFFKALVIAVSAYCQRLISGLDHPEHMASQSSPVSVEPDEGQYHRLIVKPELLNGSSSESTDDMVSKTIKLSTVQLFDMAEAIDQFYADSQALPDVSVGLAPLPRKYVRAAEPLTQRVIPPLLGMGTLAVAAFGLFFLPVPELAEPEALEQQNTSRVEDVLDDPTSNGISPTTDDDVATELPTDETDASEVTDEVTGETAPTRTTITDSTQLVSLQQQVQQQLSTRLPSDAGFTDSLSYQVSVAENGDIVGYNPLNDTSLNNLDDTPLPELTYIPVGDTSVGPLAQFEVTFATDGTVEVVSDQIVTPEPETDASEATIPDVVESSNSSEDPNSSEDGISSDNPSNDMGQQSSAPNNDVAIDSNSETITSPSATLSAFVATPIQDVDRIYELNQELRRTIINNRDPDRTGPELRYRVRLDQAGNITGYQATNPAAEDYADDFKLSGLSQAIPEDQPQLDFLVVINDVNVVEVNPWDGWPEE